MFFNKKQNKPEIPQENFLLFVPHMKHTEWIEKDGFVLLIFHHNHPIQKAANWLVKKSSTSDIKFDDLGSTVWKAIDGKRNLYEIGEIVKTKFGASSEPVYERLIMYIRYLNRRGWIYFENIEARMAKSDKKKS